MSEPLAEVLGLTPPEFEIYKDYQDNGCPDSDRLIAIVKKEAQRRIRGEIPITGAMVATAMQQHTKRTKP